MQVSIWEADPRDRDPETDPRGWGLWGPRLTCERVSPFVAEAADSCQHILLGAEGIEIPLSLGVPTVLSQACSRGGAGERRQVCVCEPPDLRTASPGHQGGPVFHREVTRMCPQGASCPACPHGDPCLGVPPAPLGTPCLACRVTLTAGALLLFLQEALGLRPDFQPLRAGHPLRAGRWGRSQRGR